MTGDADYGLGADQTTGGRIVGILLAHMDAIGAGFCGEVRPVVDQQGDVIMG